MRLIVAIAISCAALWTGCVSSHSKADSREMVDKHRPDWLPATAQMIYSSRWEDGFLGDATTKVKARVTAAEFESAVKKLELTRYRDVSKSSYGSEPPQWMSDSDKRWDPSSELDDTFIRQQGRWWQLAKYQNGFLYYQAVSY